MTPEVVELLRALHADIVQFPRLALLSPGRAERALLPRARVLRREDWDLDQPRRDLRFDLIIACHVFHYARDPARWFANTTASCRALLIADLIQRKRSADAELGLDGDATRYAIDAHRPRIAQLFDLRQLGERLLAHHVFAGAANEYGPALHVLALIRGQLDGPLIHLVGDPASTLGADESDALRAMLEHFEARGQPAYLGIAPTQLSAAAGPYLRGLRHLAPALHQHALRKSPRRWFDELAWSTPARVHELLAGAKTTLEQALGRSVTTYVAPHGRLSRRAAAALARLGVDLCVSERQTQPKLVPSLRADFMGPVQKYPLGRMPEVIGLDLHAEAARPRVEQRANFMRMFEAIDAQRGAALGLVRGLATRVSGLAR